MDGLASAESSRESYSVTGRAIKTLLLGGVIWLALGSSVAPATVDAPVLRVADLVETENALHPDQTVRDTEIKVASDVKKAELIPTVPEPAPTAVNGPDLDAAPQARPSIKPKSQRPESRASVLDQRVQKAALRMPQRSTNPKRPIVRKDGIFNTLELQFNDSTRIKDWAQAHAGLRADISRIRYCLGNAAACQGDAVSNWVGELRAMSHVSLDEKIRGVNDRVNRIRYTDDNVNYGQNDFWARPEMFLRNGGDCEDYALLKFASLASLGVPENRMRFVVGYLPSGTPHAVLAVQTGSGEIILDNRTGLITSADNPYAFQPRYSMNFQHRWTHKARPVLVAQNDVKKI